MKYFFTKIQFIVNGEGNKAGIDPNWSPVIGYGIGYFFPSAKNMGEDGTLPPEPGLIEKREPKTKRPFLT